MKKFKRIIAAMLAVSCMSVFSAGIASAEQFSVTDPKITVISESEPLMLWQNCGENMTSFDDYVLFEDKSGYIDFFDEYVPDSNVKMYVLDKPSEYEHSEYIGFTYEKKAELAINLNLEASTEEVMKLLEEKFGISNENGFKVRSKVFTKEARPDIEIIPGHEFKMVKIISDKLDMELAEKITELLRKDNTAEQLVYTPSYVDGEQIKLQFMYPVSEFENILDILKKSDIEYSERILLSERIPDYKEAYECDDYFMLRFDQTKYSQLQIAELAVRIYEETGLRGNSETTNGRFPSSEWRFGMPEYVYMISDEESASFEAAGNTSDDVLTADLNSDGIVDVTDLTQLSLSLADGVSFTETQKNAADIDGDGSVTLADLARLKQYISKMITSL